ncbi:MAG: DciA family protein [Actinomycetaceae bacterium]|nr:DciA family protein [Actinomycetaceae bacterium]
MIHSDLPLRSLEAIQEAAFAAGYGRVPAGVLRRKKTEHIHKDAETGSDFTSGSEEKPDIEGLSSQQMLQALGFDPKTLARYDWGQTPAIARGRTGARKSRFDPKKLGSLARGFIKREGWDINVRVAQLKDSWEEIVGTHVAQHCVIDSFDEGRLTLRATSTAWAQQIKALLPQLERRLDEELGSGVIKLVVVHGPQAPTWRRGPRTVPGPGPRDTYG